MKKKIISILGILMIFSSTSTNASQQYRWYVSQLEDTTRDKTMVLDSGPYTIILVGGWSCSISAESIYNARQTKCTKNSEEVEFSVQCDERRNEDHTQLRFRSGKFFDFIEVGCKELKI